MKYRRNTGDQASNSQLSSQDDFQDDKNINQQGRHKLALSGPEQLMPAGVSPHHTKI
jgi:hypothetical protein